MKDKDLSVSDLGGIKRINENGIQIVIQSLRKRIELLEKENDRLRELLRINGIKI